MKVGCVAAAISYNYRQGVKAQADWPRIRERLREE